MAANGGMGENAKRIGNARGFIKFVGAVFGGRGSDAGLRVHENNRGIITSSGRRTPLPSPNQ